MAQDDIRGKHSRPTELRAYTQLSDAVAEPVNSPGWLRRAIAAVHVCTFAIEERLDALSAPEGIIRKVEEEEPALSPAFAKLTEQFNSLLAEAWEAMAASLGPSDQFHAQLRSLADDFRSAIGHEFAVTEDAMNRMSGGLD